MRLHRPMLAAALAAAACVAAAATWAAGRVTILVLDAPDRQATLVLPRSRLYGMRSLESETSLCARQRPGSPLHSIHLPPEFCPMALATGVAAPGQEWMALPYLPALRTWVR